METILDKLIAENEFPVVFIGAGISKRFLKDFPDWTRLLEEFWIDLGYDNFYGEFNNIRNEISNFHPEYSEKELDHYSNIKMGTILEEEYNKAFNSQKVKLANFTPKDAYETKISPFKKAITERFETYTLKSEMEKEFLAFKKMLLKTQIILTTNYDNFIEDTYNQDSNYNITKYIGQKGFFRESIGYAELYKLHGSVDSPMDIIITEKDYANFEKNSVLISAKIISMMMNSPIIFIGYSLTDINVRKIIKEFTRSLTDEEIDILENRLVLIEHSKDENNFVEEIVNEKDLGCKLKVIKTDNYELLFKKIGSINQGIAPTEVRKYQHVIKNLIIDSGKKGALKSVLLSPVELEKLEQIISQGETIKEKIVVALGDSKVIFQIPNKLTYLEDYIFEKDNLSTDVILRFLANENTSGRYPFLKYVTYEIINTSNLLDSEKERLRQRLATHGDLSEQIRKIPDIYKVEFNSLESIIKKGFVMDREYCIIAYNMENLNLREVEKYVKEKVKELIESGESKINTHFRRLLLIYDHLKIKEGKRLTTK